MVVCALGIVVYFSYLTVRDILTDLQREGILVEVTTGNKNKRVSPMGVRAYGRCVRYVGGLIGADCGLVHYSYSTGIVSGNWAGSLAGGYYGHHPNGRRSRE